MIKDQIEQQMAEWLAHPMEFGVRPEMVRLKRTYKAQLITYLKLTELPVGLLMNFNVPLLKYGTQRVVRPDLMIRKT